MIIQTTITRDECFLIKELLPIWKKYSDVFVFLVDSRTTDDTIEYLNNNKEKFNILEIVDYNWESAPPNETEAHVRQHVFDIAYKYSNNIICLDTDEYIDGSMSKQELENILITETDTVFLLEWMQYVNKNEIRIDGAWAQNFKDRIGKYSCNAKYIKRHNHASHLPIMQMNSETPKIKTKYINSSQLFCAHLQWLDKRHVGLKQYFWKVYDYVQHKLYNADIISCKDYDNSVNNFLWETKKINYPLLIDDNIYKKQNIKENSKLKFIVEQTQKHNIPNLGDWGMGIYDYAIKNKI